MRPGTQKRPRRPLDRQGLERLALFYAGRYATTRARLLDYLRRKLRERGWEDAGTPDIEALADRFAERGYVDDAAFAAARASALQRRGFGERRVNQALRHAGIGEKDARSAMEDMPDKALETALRFARRKRIGPYAPGEADRESRRKAFAAMMRAGHSAEVVRRVFSLSPEEAEDQDIA